MDICTWCDETYDSHCEDCGTCSEDHSLDCEAQWIACDWCDNYADLFGQQWRKIDWCGADNVCHECEYILTDKLIEVICSIKLPA